MEKTINKMNFDDIREYHKTKSKELLSTIVSRNMNLVPMVVNRYVNQRHEFYYDLVQEGYFALISAIKKFDFSKNTEFSTYACPYIDGYLKVFLLKNSSLLHISRNTICLVNKINKYESKFYTMFGRYPTIEEFSLEFNVSVEKMQELYVLVKQKDVYSLDQVVSEDDTDPGDDYTLYCVLEDNSIPSMEQQIDNIFIKEVIKGALTKLSKREILAISLRFGLDDGIQRTNDYIGERLNCSGESVRQLINRIINKLFEEPSLRTLAYKKLGYCRSEGKTSGAKEKLYGNMSKFSLEQKEVLAYLFGLNGYDQHSSIETAEILRKPKTYILEQERRALASIDFLRICK